MFHRASRFKGIILVVLALALAACGGTVDPETIQGAWVLETAVVDGEPYELPFEYAGSDGVLTSARFDEDGVLWFEGPCNDGRGDYEFDGRVLVLTDVMHSAVYCVYPGGTIDEEGNTESPLMDAEEVILASIWAGAIDVTFSGTDPEIMEWTQNGTVLTFHREPGD